MTAKPAPTDLNEVLRLTGALTEQVLDAQIMGRPIHAERISALAKAASLLQDRGVEWPPLLSQVMHDLAKDAVLAAPSSATEAPDAIDRQGLSRFFAGFRKEKG